LWLIFFLFFLFWDFPLSIAMLLLLFWNVCFLHMLSFGLCGYFRFRCGEFWLMFLGLVLTELFLPLQVEYLLFFSLHI
jgi:hypothetical protein